MADSPLSSKNSAAAKRPVVIGLEVHIQLNTKTKLFCPCSTDYIGRTPNTNVCPICLAVPGTLPLLNDLAVALGSRMGLGLHCEIQNYSNFHRKNYFYPDLSKAYQITQYGLTIAVGGYIDIEPEGRPKRVRVHHLHLEEDAGKLVHPTADGRLTGAAYSLVDYNRGGVPLSEIVSEPDMSSPAEARDYVIRLRQLARYLDVSDGEMESGSLRVDANISLSNPDGSLGTRVEIKNMNSLKSLERALEYEISRQNKVLDSGGRIVQETRLWDDAEEVTRSMRSKETASDYRYYPEMDLAPIVITDEQIEDFKRAMPELPWEKRERFAREFGLSGEEVAILTEQKELARYYEETIAAGAPPARAANWVRMEVLRVLNETGTSISDFPLGPSVLAELVKKVESKELSSTIAKDILDTLSREDITLDEAVKRSGASAVRLTGCLLDEVVDRICAANPGVVETIKSGRDKKGGKMKFLQGLVMKETRGQADPSEAAGSLSKKLGA
ncbi:MAG: Asp-tRNA(Asn)/Glu-tRNA(Gln) amidotransferase subunit GatB [Synergistaceae bacterium]|jgi:aspartyl-tRNA(Asn)/glutamyl-tRNA(Gln) amidotransferase subunit B|nr:Asp-tRNA(Asn)/Glu-tRNA(Gln) amidotransferase subunit GatB [Synergistaceae bacterium]